MPLLEVKDFEKKYINIIKNKKKYELYFRLSK